MENVLASATVMLCGLEGNRRSGVAQATHHRLNGLSICGLSGLEGDEHEMACFTSLLFLPCANASCWLACHCPLSDPRNMVPFGVLSDVRLARVLGLSSSATAMMLRPFNTSLVYFIRLWNCHSFCFTTRLTVVSSVKAYKKPACHRKR